MLERIKRIFKRSSSDNKIVDIEPAEAPLETEDKQDEVVEESDSEEVDPWESFVGLCRDLGFDYREVVDKAAWYYIEESGFAKAADPIAQAKELADAINSIEEAFRKLNEPASVKKLRQYKDAIKELSEFKQAVRELKQGKMTTLEMITVVRDLLQRFS